MSLSDKRRKLASEIIPLPNPDKEFHETWAHTVTDEREYKRHPLNVPHPSRWVLFGPPGSGKTTVVLNAIARQDPPFTRIFLIHVDGEYTKEYDRLKTFEKLDNVPPPSFWEGGEKTAVIVDDVEYKFMDAKQKGYLDRLFGYVSTHKNITVYLTAQDGFNVPTCVRRCADMLVLWKNRDLAMLARLTAGLRAVQLKSVFDHYKFDVRDSIWFDTTPDSPYPIRINGTINVSTDEFDSITLGTIQTEPVIDNADVHSGQ